MTDWIMVSQTISFVPSIWSDSHSIWSSTIQSLIQISCGMVWDRLRVLVSVPHLRLFTGPPLSFTGPLIFSVGSLGLWITPKLSTHLLFKKGQICGAAMCTFPTHFVKHPIVFKHSETNLCLGDRKMYGPPLCCIHLPNVSRHFLNASRHFLNVSRHFLNVSIHFRNVSIHFRNVSRHLLNISRQFLNVWRHFRNVYA